MLPTVGILLLTYERTEYAKRTVASVFNHLKYDGEIVWYVADDGSSATHFDEICAYICEHGGSLVSSHQTKADNRGYGVNANTAWKWLHQNNIDITFWLEDDWEMVRDFDITPHVNTINDGHAGMIRTAFIPLWASMKTTYHSEQYYLELLKDALYAYSGNPHLKHHDFALSYGFMPEDRNPGETEIAYDHIVRHTEGLPILIPAEICNPPFQHIGDVKSYE